MAAGCIVAFIILNLFVRTWLLSQGTEGVLNKDEAETIKVSIFKLDEIGTITNVWKWAHKRWTNYAVFFFFEMCTEIPHHLRVRS